ncbi:hypothetical protein D9758_013921 [Tetrapyrgos nigripes]|uniref:F-box domain-containing protein n=1 Tax=Tetrapyrgos nigripes TaxID=182062 RepID=A0A8H5FQ56_9AGAR|nr:hypothetical protein D9758_013921 [Tetrapyrgos nigripes]
MTRILRTGRPVSKMEAIDIQNTVDDLDLAISRQKKDMQEVYQRHHEEEDEDEEALRKYEEKMANFKTSLEALQTKRKRFHSALSPIRMLHPEILSLIFITYFELYTSGNCFVEFDTSPIGKCKTSCGLTRLALVCAHWYEVLLETPRLWGTMTIDIGAGNKSLDDLTPAIMLHLARSKQAPLHVDFHFGGRGFSARFCHPPDLNSADGFLQIFAAEQSRWRHLRIDARIFSCPESEEQFDPEDRYFAPEVNPDSEDGDALARLVTKRMMLNLFNKPDIGGFTFPLLESLEVDGGQQGSPGDLDFIQHCPVLKHLSLSRYPPIFLLSLQNWNQITRLELKALDVDDMLEAILLCPNVVSVSVEISFKYVRLFDLYDDKDDPKTPPIHVVSSSIRDLAIRPFSSKEAEQSLTWERLDKLLQLLTCPSLHSFELAMTGFIRDDSGTIGPQRMKKLMSSWPGDTLLDFITRARTAVADNSSPDAESHSLRVLKLKDLPLTPENLLSILETIPSLLDLTIHEMKQLRSGQFGPGLDHHIPNNTLVDSFFEAMIIDGKRPVILPLLQRIELKLHISSHEKDIERLIRSRWEVAHDSNRSESHCVNPLQCAVIELIGDSDNQPRDWFAESESESGSGLYGIRDAGMLIKVAWETPGEREQGEKGRVVIPLKDTPGSEGDQKPQGLYDDDLDVDVDEYFTSRTVGKARGVGSFL